MLHFTVVCEMGQQDHARTRDTQTVASFVSLGTLRATDSGIGPDKDCRCGKRFILDPVKILRDHGLLPA